MSNDNDQHTAQQETPQQQPPQPLDSTGQPPAYIAYTVVQPKGRKGYFNNIGAAFEHKDCNGFDIDLHSIPVNGRITLRKYQPKQIDSGNPSQAQTQKPGMT